MTYQQHETLDDGAVLMAVTEDDGRSVGYVFRNGQWFGEFYEAVTDPRKVVTLGQLFASGRARQSIDRYLDS